MVHIKPISIIFSLSLVILATLADEDEEKRKAAIEALEKEKNELYKQINDAIDDSVKNLEVSNDTDAKIGINLVTDLKKQLALFNGNNTQAMMEQLKAAQLRNDSRRNIYEKPDKEFYDDIADKKGSKYKERLVNRVEMQKRIETWLKNRADEKEKIKKYILSGRRLKPEKCGRDGVDKKKRKKPYKGYVPCCRKCCKKSYMGCLK